MNASYKTMIEKLQKLYKGWGLEIEAPPNGPRSGGVRQVGGSGLVRYVFSENDKGAYLEYYSFHRIGGDAHARIYASGEVDRLDTIGTMYIVTGDKEKDEAEWQRIQQRNREVMKELDDAGLLSGGPVPNSFVINSAIATGAVDPDELDDEEDED